MNILLSKGFMLLEILVSFFISMTLILFITQHLPKIIFKTEQLVLKRKVSIMLENLQIATKSNCKNIKQVISVWLLQSRDILSSVNIELLNNCKIRVSWPPFVDSKIVDAN